MERRELIQEIEERIVFMEYEPGKKLKEDELCEEFDIGRTPLRETLIKLECRGLIRTVPQKGTYVSAVSLQKLRNAYEVRNYLIRQAGAKAANRIKPTGLGNLRELVSEMRTEDDPKSLIRLDFRAHELINQAAGNTPLTKELRRLRQLTLRGLAAPNFNEPMGGFAEEFSKLAESLSDGDGSRTGELLGEHLKNFLEKLSRRFIATEHGRRRK
ncbi:MAG: GntR family transcriptional regulator [Candidatus Acetothermia bacterium]